MPWKLFIYCLTRLLFGLTFQWPTLPVLAGNTQQSSVKYTTHYMSAVFIVINDVIALCIMHILQRILR